MTLRIAAIALLLLAPSVGAQGEPQDPLEKRISLDRTGTLREHLDLFELQTGLLCKIGASEDGDPDLNQKIQVALKDVKASSALYWIARLHGTGAVFRDGKVLVDPRYRGTRGEPVPRSYGLEGLPTHSRTIVAPRLGLGRELQPGLQVLKVEPKPATDEVVDVIPDEQLLLDLIKGNVAPGSWEGNVTVDLDPAKKLLVSQTPEGHRELEWFLGALKAFPPSPVSVTLLIAEADESTADLLAPGAPLVFSPEAADGVARRLRERKGRSVQLSGLAGDQFHTFLTEESSGVSGFMKGNPTIGKWFSEALLLDVRPFVIDHGRSIHLDLHLSLGHTRALDPVKTRPGLLPLHERQLAELGTSVRMPSGGGLLLSLPSRNPSDPHPRIALLRASAAKAALAPAPAFLMSPRPGAEVDPLLEKLKAVPARDLDLKDATVGEFAVWLREAGGVNVVVDPGIAELKISIRVRALKLSETLTLALNTRQLMWSVGHEAVLLQESAEFRRPVQTCVLGLTDVVVGAGDCPARPATGPEAPLTWGFEDLVNLMKNTVDREQWEEADGKSLMWEYGMLVLRNEERVLKHCLEFVAERRSHPPRMLSLRADMLLLPDAAAEEILGAGGEGPALLDADRVGRLLKVGKVLERLAWVSVDQQLTSQTWDRSRDHLHSVDGDDPILRADVSPASLEVRPTLDQEGKSSRIEVRYEDRRLTQLKEVKVSDELTLQVPSGQTVTAKSTIQLPVDRTAVFRWSAAVREGEAPSSRLLLLSVTPQ